MMKLVLIIRFYYRLNQVGKLSFSLDLHFCFGLYNELLVWLSDSYNIERVRLVVRTLGNVSISYKLFRLRLLSLS